MILQLTVVLVAIVLGSRLGGIGLGVMGGLGVAILTFIFGLPPTSPPIDVMLMIVSVIAAASCLQAAGGLDLMVSYAERILRRHPQHITLLSPAITYLFTFVSGTGHVAYAVLPVIAEVSHQTGIRPERPLSIAVIASQQAITASPISAATVVVLSMLGGYSITLLQILMIAVPCTLLGVLAGSLYAMRMGVELGDDAEYRRRLQSGECSDVHVVMQAVGNVRKALTAIAVFMTAMIGIVLFGSVESWRPTFEVSGELVTMQMSHIIEILMLSASALILLLTRSNGMDAVRGSVFSSGMQAVVAIFGIAWMGDTFIASNVAELRLWIEEYVTRMPWLFGLALFTMSIMLYSQAATVRALLPLGIALGLSPWMLIALFPAVNGYFFFPNYPTVVAAISFDRTGTTRIGSYILNHSFMLPGLIATGVSVGLGLLLVRLIV